MTAMNDNEAGSGGLQILDDSDDEAGAAMTSAAPIAMEAAAASEAVAAAGGPGAHARVLIIGSGPAGLTAAIYAARADLEPLVIAGFIPGGQLMITSEVENYPGFAEGIDGPALMAAMRAQAERFGSRVHDIDVDSVDFSERPFKVTAGGTQYTADCVIVATGASAIWLDLENETRLRGRGVSACATCDGFFFRDKKIAVVGGGDSALEEALFLTKFGREVVLIHRREEFRGSRIMQNRAKAHPKISIEWNTQITDVLGKDKIEALELTDTKTGEVREMPIEGLFVAIGHKPNTEVFKEYLDVDEKGYLEIEDHTLSNVEGVFVAGDVHDHRYRQAVTAAGDGCRAAIDAERWLEEQAAGPSGEAMPSTAGEAVSLA
jgi:thioredoxin reductase (NADPH)